MSHRMNRPNNPDGFRHGAMTLSAALTNFLTVGQPHRLPKYQKRQAKRLPYNLLLANIYPQNLAFVVINPRISPRVQRTFVRDRTVVGGRRVKIIHLELFSVYANDVSFRVTGRWLLMKNLNRPFDNFISFPLIC